MRYQKGTFITVPNTPSVMGIGPGPQALYMWLCRYANTDGECFPSRGTLANDIGCSDRSIDSYMDELVKIGLVKKEHQFNGNEHTSNMYYLPIGGEKSSLGSENISPGVAKNLRTELNPVLTQSIYSGESKIRVEKVTEKEERQKADTSYLSVFQLWGDYPINWRKNKTEIFAAKNLLQESTLEDMKWALDLYQKYKGNPYCPAILKPSDLDRKWDNLIAFKKKHG